MTRRVFSLLLLIVLTLACNYAGGEKTSSEAPLDPLSTAEPTSAYTPEAALTLRVTEAFHAPTPMAGNLIVAYTKEGNLWRWSQGQSRQLTQAGETHRPRFSPDGKIIAYLKPADDFHLEIWAINTDGGNERKLVSIADLDAIGGGVRDPGALAIHPYRLAWIPGTHVLAFNTQQVFQGPGLSLLNDLNLVDADSLQITNLFLAGWGGEFLYSPDGSQVTISQPDKIILAKADGSEYRTLFNYQAVTTYSEYRYYALPVWMQDGKSLCVALPPTDPLAEPRQPTSFWRVYVDGSAPVEIGNIHTVPFFEQPVEISPDLARIAYLIEIGQPAENLRELHLAANDGQKISLGDGKYIQGAPIHFEGWSPDSTHFAFTLGKDQEAWLGSLQEAPSLLGVGMVGIQNFRWVNDNQFLFWKYNPESFDLMLGNLEGGTILLDSVIGSPPAFDFVN